MPTCCSLAVDRAPGAPEQPHPIAGGKGQVVFLPPLVDCPVERLVAADLAACLQPLADRLADLGDVLVGRRADGDAALRARAQQDVAPGDVEIGDLRHDLIAVAADHHGVAVRSLHVERLGRLPFAEKAGDLPAALGGLAHGGEQFRQGFRRKGTAKDLDAVARLDRLCLLPVAEHLDRHAGLRLQLEELEQRARADLARLVQHQDGVAVCLELAAVDHRQQGREGVGPADAGVLEGIGLAPGHRGTDHLPALGAEPRVRVPGVHQGLQQRRLAGAGDAGEHRQRAALPERVDGGALLGRKGDSGVVDRPAQCLD